MECEDIRKRLKAFFDDEVGTADRTAIQEHLEHCPGCAGVVRQFERLTDVLKAWKAEAPPADMYDRLKAGLESRESWWKKLLTPAFAGRAALRFAGIAAVVFITLAVSHYFQKTAPLRPDDDLATINFYVTEHQAAVLQAASMESAERPAARVTLSRDDIMYYEFIDDYRRISRPGVILRGSASLRGSGPAAPGSGLSSAKALTLPQARKEVSFDPVAPSRIHPGYILDTITKVAGRNSLHLLYTNGIENFSVFEQPLDGGQGLAARDFREYAVYKSSSPAEIAGNQGGTTILAWKNTHVSFVLISRADMSRLMEIAQVFADASKSINMIGE
ncbi:MAG: zf-HC2 domain-containing protein [Candidatus Aminicenantes bacterium]|nr:zf-HC2 domain-containing protein [Candidatus Aminicenantes bacterium]